MANKFSVEVAFKANDKISTTMRKMESSTQKFTRSLERGFRRANNSLNKLSEKMKTGFRRGAIALGAAITGVSIAIKDLAERADDLSKQAKVLDMPIKDLQEWQFVAEQSGISADSFTKSLGILDKQIGQAKTGTGTLVTMLKKTNPELLKQLTSSKNTSKALDLVLKTIRKMKSPADKAAFAFAAFGRAGLQTIIMADTSAKALAKLREEARKNGLITQLQATAAEAFNDQLNSLKHTFQGLLQGALLPLMPIMTKYLKLVQDWVFANRKLLTANVKGFVIGIAKAVAFLVRHGKAIIIFGASVLGLMAILRTFILIMTAVNFVLDANPIGLIVIGVAALAAGLTLLFVKWKFFGTLVLTVVGVIKSALKEVWSILKIIGKTIEIVINSIESKIRAVTGVISKILHPFSNGIEVNGSVHNSGFNPASGGASIISPQKRLASALSNTVTTNKSEVTIKDDTNRAVVTKGKLGNGLSLASSGAF